MTSDEKIIYELDGVSSELRELEDGSGYELVVMSKNDAGERSIFLTSAEVFVVSRLFVDLWGDAIEKDEKEP